jgi:hypothetical protein
LNANLYLQLGSVVYVYWVQDVAILNSSSGHIVFEDNVWNSSAPGAGLTSSSLQGNGSIATSGSSTYYYDFAAPTLPGNQAILTFPTNVTLEVVAYVTDGGPEVTFEYNDGLGWQTYDNVLFPSATAFTDYGFLVDGFAYEPNGLYYDAELIMGGPGGGAQTNISKTNIVLFLEYWNEHNFQEVQNAYNFGSDTEEGLNNGLSSGHYYVNNGSLFATVTSTLGGLGAIYDRTFVGIVNISTPLSSGELYINGTDYGPFVWDEVNVTIAPGTYTFAVYSNGVLIASKLASVGRGQYISLRIGYGALFEVTFTETGLPSGTQWSIELGPNTMNSTLSSIIFTEPNGSLAFTVGAVAGFLVNRSSGSIQVTGESVFIDLAWTQRQFVVTFDEYGLPIATLWSVTLLGETMSSSSSTINFTEANGIYSYSIGAQQGYRTGLLKGSVRVLSANVSVAIDWTVVTYTVWFNETGLPFNSAWQVNLQEGGIYLNGTYRGSSASFLLPNGSFGYSVSGPTTYAVTPTSGQVTVVGGDQSVAVTFTIRNGYLVVSLIPSSATLWIGNSPVSVAEGRFNSSLAPGTYAIEATASGYLPFFRNVTVSAVQDTWLNISLNSTSNPSGSQPLGLPPLVLAGVVAGVVVVLAVVLVLLTRRQKPTTPAGNPPPQMS